MNEYFLTWNLIVKEIIVANQYTMCRTVLQLEVKFLCKTQKRFTVVLRVLKVRIVRRQEKDIKTS